MSYVTRRSVLVFSFFLFFFPTSGLSYSSDHEKLQIIEPCLLAQISSSSRVYYYYYYFPAFFTPFRRAE